MIAALQARPYAIATDPDARVVVLAAGGRGFSAGHDAGTGKMLAYATVNDNTSGDAVYLAAE